MTAASQASAGTTATPATNEGSRSAGQPLEAAAHEEALRVRVGTGRETMRRLMVKARQECPRVVFPEGSHPTILRACSILADEGLVRPILLGSEAAIRRAMEETGVEAAGATIVRHDTGTPLIYNKEDLLNPWHIVTRKK